MNLMNRVFLLYLSYRHNPYERSTRPILQGPNIFYIFNLQSGYHSKDNIWDLLWLFYVLGYDYSDLSMPSVQDWLLSVLLMYAQSYQVFHIFSILVHSPGNGKYVACLSSIADFRPAQLYVMQRFYIMDFSTMDCYGFHQLYFTIRKNYYWLPHQASSLYIFQNGSVFWNSSSILFSADIRSVLPWHRQRIYTAEVQ